MVIMAMFIFRSPMNPVSHSSYLYFILRFIVPDLIHAYNTLIESNTTGDTTAIAKVKNILIKNKYSRNVEL